MTLVSHRRLFGMAAPRRGTLARARFAAVIILGLLFGATPRAQAPALSEPAGGTGWQFSHTLAVSTRWDDNVSLASQGEETATDHLTTANPRFSLAFRGRRSNFALDYSGAYHFYGTLTSLNGFDQRALASFSRRVSPRLSLFARNSLAVAPTTEDIDVPGISFRRVGARLDDLTGGLDLMPNRRTTISTAYVFQWVDFAEDERLAPLFRGGHSHGATATVARVLTPRVSLEGDYNFRHAIVGGGEHQIGVQHATAGLAVGLTPSVELSAGAGYAWVTTSRIPARSAPAYRVRLTREGERLAWSILYRRSFMPSFGFGGTFQNQELRGSLLVPLGRRIDWTNTVTIRQHEPLAADQLDLRSSWLRSTLSIRATRWLALEGFYSGLSQDSRRAGGQIERTSLGFQVVSRVMRIR